MRLRVGVVACAALLAVSLVPTIAASATTVVDREALMRVHRDPKAPCFRWPAVDMDGDGVFDRVDNCVNTPKGCTVDQWGCETDSDGDGVWDGLDQCPTTQAGVKVAKLNGLDADAGARSTSRW